MKINKIMTCTAILLCALTMGICSSCSSEDNDNISGVSSEEVIQIIKSNLYDDQGGIAANQLSTYQEGEYNLITDEESEVCTFFSGLTGMKVQSQNIYEYTYKSSDGKCQIQIKGSQIADNGVYATIYFSVPECPEIKMIHIGTNAIMEGSDGNTASSGGVTHRIKGIN